jgi:anti-sigma regulatory factor (Ser/Thr protein kinase)
VIPEAGPVHRHGHAFRHEAVLYAGVTDFLARTLPFLRQGVAVGEPTLVVVGSEKIERLRHALGRDADGVEFADMADVGRNPSRMIPAWHDFVSRHAHSGTALRGIGEPISADRSTDELSECQIHEALLNRAFAEGPTWWLVCPYDRALLTAEVLDEARRTHPFVDGHGRHPHTAAVGETAGAAPQFAQPLSPAPPQAVHLSFDASSLPIVRRLVADRAVEAGFESERRDDFVLAVNEIATNTLRHGGGAGDLRLWRLPDRLVCDITDRGRLDDPLVGRIPPLPLQADGRGIWMANQLCDLVQIRSSTAGTQVRLHLLG